MRFRPSLYAPAVLITRYTIKEEAPFKALLAMDAYHNVNSGTACLAVLVTTAINDPRVPGGPRAKFAARLQAASSPDYNASHGSIKAQLDDQLADEDGLPLWLLDDPDLEPRAGVAL